MRKQAKRQLIRSVSQILFFIFAVIGFFISFSWTMFIIMFIMVLGGNFFCGWICPYGTLQEFAGKIGKLLGIKKRKLPRRFHKYFIYIRYFHLILFMFMTSGIIFSLFSVNPQSNFTALILGHTPSILASISIVLFAILSMVYERLYCNYLCFVGAKWGVMSVARLFTIVRNNEKCVNCKKCDRVCPMSIEVSKTNTMRSPSCINCFRCADACPIDDALSYRLVKLRKKTSIIYVVLVVLVGAGFVSNLYIKTGTHKISKDVDTQSILVGKEKIATDDAVATFKNTSESSAISQYKDGTYTGSAKGMKSTISVEVTIENGIISNIIITEQNDAGKWYNYAYEGVVSSIYEAQSANVDIASGATYTSKGIRDAVTEALEKAKL